MNRGLGEIGDRRRSTVPAISAVAQRKTSVHLGRATRRLADLEFARGVATQGNLRAIDLEDAGVAAGGAEAGGNFDAGEKTEFHETAGIGSGKFDPVEDGGLAGAQIAECGEGGCRIVVATQLQHAFSVGRLAGVVNCP